MRTGKPCEWIVLLTALAGVASVRGQSSQPAVDEILAAGFRPHVTRLPGGRIDWTDGVVIAEGLGRARGSGAQQRLMAQRAAELVAARNAIALAGGISIDADGRISAVRSGGVAVRGVVRGQEVTRVVWEPTAQPPQCRLEMRVPLWGVSGIASPFWRARQVQSLYAGTPRMPLGERSAAGTTVIVLDARGQHVYESLFPTVVDTQGRVIYDLATLSTETAQAQPPARYVELRAAVSDTEVGRLAGSSNSHWRWTVLKVQSAASAGNSLTLSPGQAESLARSPELAAALQAGRVLILVDRAQ